MDGTQESDLLFHSAQVRLSEEELAAVDGWRQANSYSTRAEALRELVRLGLLSEIGRIYRATVRSDDEGDRRQ